MIRTQILAAFAVLALTAGAAQAQKPTGQAHAADRADQLLSQAQPATPTVNDGEAYHRADDSEQDPAEVRTTQALNDEIASRNQLAQNQEDADRARYEETVTASTQAQLAYEADVRRSQAAQSDWEAEQARWQAERARWEADVRACEAGNRSRCSTRVR
ncbi:hypothetical protein ACETK8_00230 [Brevundimonas staleyi]|uniref:Cell wall hydrolase n=1 Tax=Brevundimonas staleyi TaxID=74326 RepID=A0ABW0FRD1_9CAUL